MCHRYMNADILFCSELVDTLRAVVAGVESKKLKPKVLVVGRRTNVRFAKKLHDRHAVRMCPALPCACLDLTCA